MLRRITPWVWLASHDPAPFFGRHGQKFHPYTSHKEVGRQMRTHACTKDTSSSYFQAPVENPKGCDNAVPLDHKQLNPQTGINSPYDKNINGPSNILIMHITLKLRKPPTFLIHYHLALFFEHLLASFAELFDVCIAVPEGRESLALWQGPSGS
jgi:hypothetical protein